MSDNAFIHKEAFNMLCGKLLGTGSSRQVWQNKLDASTVIKTEDGSGSFQNVMEWETWQRVKDTQYSRWFAECKAISPCGSVLVMQKTVQPYENDYPSMVPIFLTDLKRTNYGIITNVTGRKQTKTLVCHDYGTNLLMEYGMYSKKQKKADWWNK